MEDIEQDSGTRAPNRSKRRTDTQRDGGGEKNVGKEVLALEPLFCEWAVR